MKTLDDQLNEVGKEMLDVAHRDPHKTWREPHSTRRGLAAAIAGIALVVALVGLPALMFTGTDGEQSPVGATPGPSTTFASDEVPTPTTVVSSTVTSTDTVTTVPENGTTVTDGITGSDFPYLMLSLVSSQEWSVIAVQEKTVLEDGQLATIAFEENREDGSGLTMYLEIGDAEPFYYREFIRSLDENGSQAKQEATIRGQTLTIYQSHGNLWGAEWEESTGYKAYMLIDGGTASEFLTLADALTSASEEEWLEASLTN